MVFPNKKPESLRGVYSKIVNGKKSNHPSKLSIMREEILLKERFGTFYISWVDTWLRAANEKMNQITLVHPTPSLYPHEIMCEKVMQEIQPYLTVPICQVILGQEESFKTFWMSASNGIALTVQQMAIALIVKQEQVIPLTTVKEFEEFFKIHNVTRHYLRGRAFLKCPQLLLVNSPDNVIDYEEGFMFLDEDEVFYEMLVKSCQRLLQGVHGLNGHVEFFFRMRHLDESPIEMSIQQAYQMSIRNQNDVFLLVQ